jgi:hypothetical protein
MTVRLAAVGADAREAWTQALAIDEDALVSQTPAWMDCVCSSGRYEDATRVYRTDDGRALILPLARLCVPKPVSAVSSMPFAWGTGGLVSSGGPVQADDLACVIADLLDERLLLAAVRPSPTAADAWAPAVPDGAVRIPHMSQIVPLAGGFDTVWRAFSSSVRSNCRKAVRRGVSAERDDTGRLMPVFDGLYRRCVDRWARQQHEPRWLAHWRSRHRDPVEKFQSVAAHLGPACHVWVAWRGGEPIASVVVVAHGRQSTMWRAVIDKDACRGTGATELLHQLAFEEACENGYRFCHLGDSAPSSSLAHNKRGFGAREAWYYGYRFERLPVTAVDQFARRQVKKVVGFRD